MVTFTYLNSSSTLVLTYTHLPIQGGARFGALSRDRGGHLSAGHHQAHRAPHARVRGVRVPVRRDRAGRRAGASLRLAARGVLGEVHRAGIYATSAPPGTVHTAHTVASVDTDKRRQETEMTGPRAHRTATHTVCVTGGVGSRGCDLFACQIKT